MKVTDNELIAYVQAAPVLNGDSRCGEAARLFGQYPDADCAVVTNAGGIPSGLLMKHRFLLHINGSSGLDRFEWEPVGQLTNAPLVMDKGCTPPELLSRAMRRPLWSRFDSVVVSHNGIYAGVIPSGQLTYWLNEGL